MYKSDHQASVVFSIALAEHVRHDRNRALIVWRDSNDFVKVLDTGAGKARCVHG
jgi:hypothetical protein